MTTLKETLEVGESSVSQGSSHSKAESGHLRSDAVSLDVPVRVHGSRVTEIVRGITPHTEPFEEQTTTMIVFPQGGVLRMSTAVSVGQAVVLTNLKSRQDAICRVVKVRTNPNLHSYIEIEFTHAQPGYWGVHFASDGPAPPKRTAPVAPPAASIPAAPVAPAVAPKSEVAAKEKTVFEVPAASVPALALAELRGDASAVSGKSSSGAKVAEEAEELEVGSQAIEESPAGKESATFGRFAAEFRPWRAACSVARVWLASGIRDTGNRKPSRRNRSGRRPKVVLDCGLRGVVGGSGRRSLLLLLTARHAPCNFSAGGA